MAAMSCESDEKSKKSFQRDISHQVKSEGSIRYFKADSGSIFEQIERESPRGIFTVKDGVATIRVNGFLAYDVPGWAEECGYATNYQSIIDAAKFIASNESIGGVALELNSGGGNVNGAFEASRAIADIALPKVAKVRSCACSATYMLASACDEIYANETAELGSIGTIITMVDTTAADEQFGYKIIAITNEGATLKSIGIGSLTEEQFSYLQERANDMGAAFHEFVLSRRPSIDPYVFNAGTWSGKRAMALGLIDGIAEV